MIAGVTRRRPPDLDPISAELVLGKEDPSLADEAPAGPEAQPTRQPPADRGRIEAPRAKLTRGDRLFVAGLVVAIAASGTLYLYRNEISAEYERRLHPERYWSAKVKSTRWFLQLAELEHQECLIDLSAARAKEPILVAKDELFGVSSSNARIWAAEETATQEAMCDSTADSIRRDREKLSAAERELARARSK
jgi:hypothetical protein